MFLDKFLSKIGDFFAGLFNSAKKTWDKLSPEVQKGILGGSGIVATINKYIDAAPDFILAAIQKKYPDFPLEKIEEALKKLAVAFNVAGEINDADLLTTIKNLQAYFASTKDDGRIWATISHAAAALLSVVLSPASTRVASVTSLLEFVYQNFIKGQEDTPVDEEQPEEAI